MDQESEKSDRYMGRSVMTTHFLERVSKMICKRCWVGIV